MTKYIIGLVGVLLLVGSAASWWRIDAVIADAESVSLQTLCEQLAERPVRHVSVQAELDLEHRVYRTGLVNPVYTMQRPDEAVSLTVEDLKDRQRMQAALGSRVEVTGVIDPVVSGAIQVIGTAPDGDDDDDAAAPETERRIGPLMGTDDTVLVLSPPFPSGGNESLMWITRDTVVGRLSPLADIRENVPGVIHGAESLRSTMRHWGANVPEDAWLIIADEEDGATVDRHLVPLAGSENRIFVALTDAEERQALTRGGVRGMLRVQPASACEGLADAMGVTLPEQIGLLSTQVPSTEGLDAGVFKAMGLGLGALFLGVAGVMFWWGRSVRARQAVPGREPLSEPVEEPWQNAA